MAVDWNNPKDVQFLKTLKSQGVDAQTALSRLEAVKSQAPQQLASSSPQPQLSPPKSTGFDWGSSVKGAIGSMTGQNPAMAQTLPSAKQAADYATESTIKPIAKFALSAPTTLYKQGQGFVKDVGILANELGKGKGLDDKLTPENYQKMKEVDREATAPVNAPFLGNLNYTRADKTGAPDTLKTLANTGGGGVDALSGYYNMANPLMGTFKQAFTRGAIQSGAKAIQEDDATPLSVGASSVAGGTLSGVLSPASLKFIGDKGNSFAKKLYSTAVKTPLKEAKYGVNIGDQLLNKGLKGSDKSLLSQVDGRRSVVINRRNDLLNNSNEKIDTQDIISKLNDYAKKQVVAPGKEETLQKSVDSMAASLKSRGKQLTPAEANKIKSALQKELKNLFGQESSAIQESNKFLARTLKGAIEKKVPGVKDLNLDYQLYKRAAKSLKDNLARGDRNNLISLSDFGIGTGAGILGGGPAGLLAVGAKKIMGSTMGKTNSAQYLNKLSKIVGKSKGDRSQILTQSLIKALLTDK